MKVLWAPWRMEVIEKGPQGSGEAGCIFCELPRAGDDAASLIVHREEAGFVILNKYPYNNGHVMVVPNDHVADPDEMGEAAFAALTALLRKTLRVVRAAYGPAGMNVGMNLGASAGAGIPGHLHWHVVPRWDGDTNFMPVVGEVKVLPEHLARSREKLARAFEADT